LFERFTDQARRVVVLAQEEARLLDHTYVGTEHELLGLIREGEGIAGRALDRHGVTLDAARRQVRSIIGTGEAAATGHFPLTPRAKKVLELAWREALQLGHKRIGTEHILLGLIREGEGVGTQVLQNLGADPRRLRQTVIQLLSGSAREEGEDDVTGSEGASLRELGPRCPSCGQSLEGSLTYRRLAAAPVEEHEKSMPILMLFCGRCGAILRSFREGEEH
jgi:ATP-dependent Clp protease ATP-binding subunit ClpC